MADAKRRSTQLLTVTTVALLFLFATALAAAQPTVVELWINQGNNLRDSMRPVVEKFNQEHTDIQIDLLDLPGNVTEEGVITRIAAGQTPDIVQGSYQWAPGWAEQGIVVELDSYIERDQFDLSDFHPLTLEAGNTYKGALIGLPFFLQFRVLYYNPNLLAESGTAPPTTHLTWDELRENLARNRRLDDQGTIERHALTISHVADAGMPAIEQVGARMWDPESMQPAIDVDKFNRAFGYYLDLVDSQLAQFNGVHYTGQRWEPFASGNSAFYLDGSYRLGVLENATDFTQVAPATRADDSLPPATDLGQRTFNILKTTPEREQAAWEVLKYISNAESLATFSSLSGQITASRSAQNHPALADRMASDNFRNIVQNVVPYASGISGVPGIGQIYGEMYTLLSELFGGERPMSSFLEDLELRVAAILSR